MKKLISILLVVLLALTFVACDEQTKDDKQSGDGTSVTTGNPDSTGDPTDTSRDDDSTDSDTSGSDTSGDDTSGGNTSSGDNSQTNPPDDDKPAEPIKADVFHRDHYYEFVWEEKDSANGVLTISEYMIASADDMAGMGLSGELTYKQNILTYNVTYTKNADGVYIAEGAVVSAASAAEGESAAAFIQMMKAGLGDSQLDVLTGRVLDGEVLTSKEDIENYIWEFDVNVKVTFTVEDGKMVVSEYVKNYTSWGFMAPTKEVCHIENDIVRTFDEYERDALVRITTYRENGVIEKEDFYSDGEISSTDYYDENGDMIMNNEQIG